MKFKRIILFHVNSFFNLFLPRVCLVCGKPISTSEKYICISCDYEMPRTNFYKFKDNPVSQVFWGRVMVESATSLFFYNKDSNYSKLLYDLKYSGMKDLARFLGIRLGREIECSDLFKDVDVIMPVPLHSRKKRIRGYNQSEWIVKGITEVFPRTVDTTSLNRTSFTSTQTKKSKEDRWKNVEGKFAVLDKESLKNKHILLVDDVLTTGSTIEACAYVLLAVEGVKVSVATLAKA